MKPKIFIGLPTMGGVHPYLMTMILAWMGDSFTRNDKNLSIYPTCGVQPVDNARNHIVEEFLKSDCTHLLFVDADTIPPRDALDKLLAVNQPIVTAITPIIEHDAARVNDSSGFYKVGNVVGMDDQRLQPETGVQPIKGAGSSCILIKREVFEKIPAPWYRFVYEDDNGKKTMVGEDIYFVIKALGAGIQGYCDTSIICNHYKPVVW